MVKSTKFLNHPLMFFGMKSLNNKKFKHNKIRTVTSAAKKSSAIIPIPNLISLTF